jgi:hypothetical protein
VVLRAWRLRRVVRRERLALAFDPMQSAPRARFLPEPAAFFAPRRLGKSESEMGGKS